MIKLLTSAADLASYDRFVRAHPEGTLWQSLEWKAYRESLKEEVRVYAAMSGERIAGSAMAIIDRTTGGYSTWDIPRGPLMSGEVESEELLSRIVEDAKRDRCISLTLSPTASLQPTAYNLQPSCRHVQPLATRILDLTQSEDAILQGMHQKGRYNIRVAEKAGVRVRTGAGEDVETFYALLRETSDRDGFKAAQRSHYERFLSDLRGSFILMAEHDEKPIAGLIGVIWNGVGIYYYGASSYADRAVMAPYALQWAAIRHCKASGCHTYDLLGISEENAPPDDPWAGITDFKRKFGGTVLPYPPERTLVFRPVTSALINLKRKILG